jgi:hypothetical protein
MRIPPISSKGTTPPYQNDWQQVCNQMQTQISAYMKAGQSNQLGGYLNNMMAFVNGLGSSPAAKQLQTAMFNLYDAVGKGGNWQAALQNVRNSFPSQGVSASDIKNAFKSAVSAILQLQPGDADSAKGYEDSLNDLIGLASPKDKALLTAPNFQNALNAFIKNPEDPYYGQMKEAAQSVLENL